ncbi:class I SAM-dependent methyltransferase [Streptomyces sp. NPDC001502]|uniref:class I SAM-dependent methyltransferase n=1 Tax=Streptomyces sp. NPDC001502 TaxID=3364578 RepID=UPI0036C41317
MKPRPIPAIDPRRRTDPGRTASNRGVHAHVGSVHRAIVFDELTAAFCREHPDAVVVSVGIGLDTRAERLAGALPAAVTWLGVDMPEVVRLRAELLPGDHSRVFPASITGPDWADQLLPLVGERRNVLGPGRGRPDVPGPGRPAGLPDLLPVRLSRRRAGGGLLPPEGCAQRAAPRRQGDGGAVPLRRPGRPRARRRGTRLGAGR